MTLGSLNFNNKRRGKQPRAHILIRLGRSLKRSRVAFARGHAVEALRRASKMTARFQHLQEAHDVPVDYPIPPIPGLPELAGQDWIDCKRALGELVPAVKAAPADPAPSSEPVAV